MKKNILGIVIAFSITTYATGSFNIIVTPSDNDYDITSFFKTGNIQCDNVSPLENEVYKDISFTQLNSDCRAEEKNSHDNSTRWVNTPDFEIDKVGNLLLDNCSQILNGGHGATNGVYTVQNNLNEIDVLCDMTTDGGGWTLVSYSGTISTNKIATTGQPDKYYLPLIFNYGTMDVNAPSNKNTFSQFKLFKDNAKSSDEILFKKTSNSTNMLIFPIQNTHFFGRDQSEGQFSINSSNRNLPYLKMTNAGNNSWKTVTNNVKWSYVNRSSGNYPGIDWNVSESLNCDNCGVHYNTGLTHRSLIYWETQDSTSSYTSTQWFHAQPLSFKDSTGPSNLHQDLEFWYREK